MEAAAPPLAFQGEIRLMSGNYAPEGWMFCEGQALSIKEHASLYSLLGTTYGGDGRTNFRLPDLRGRVAIAHSPSHPLGQAGGSESITLTLDELPGHYHFAGAVDANAGVGPAGHFFAAANAAYEPAPMTTTLAPNTISHVGGNGPHENRQPYTALAYAICLRGVFPSEN
jgi:microcystin-dependent protein